MASGMCAIEYYEMLGSGDKTESCSLDRTIYPVGKKTSGVDDVYRVAKKDGGDPD